MILKPLDQELTFDLLVELQKERISEETWAWAWSKGWYVSWWFVVD